MNATTRTEPRKGGACMPSERDDAFLLDVLLSYHDPLPVPLLRTPSLAWERESARRALAGLSLDLSSRSQRALRVQARAVEHADSRVYG